MAVKSLSISTLLLSCLLALSHASPVKSKDNADTGSASNSSSNAISQDGINPVRTTVTSSGDILDWIAIGDQGPIADPPPFTPINSASGDNSQMTTNGGVESDTGDGATTLEPASNTLQQRDLVARSKKLDPDTPSGSSGSSKTSTGQQLGIVPVLRFQNGFHPVKRAPQQISQLQQQSGSGRPNMGSFNAAGDGPSLGQGSGSGKSSSTQAAYTTIPVPINGKPFKDTTTTLLKAKTTTTTTTAVPSTTHHGKGSKLPHDKRQYAGQHWYVTSNFGAVIKGAKAIFSCFKPYVNPQDFSLLQMAIARTGTDNGGMQTVEAGYQYYPAFKNTTRIFTFFTTNGYQSQADLVGGYDQTVKGWVQSSSNFYPGIAVTNYSTFGGPAQELNLQYLYYNGNWWLWIQSEWAGYYPGSLFTVNQSSPANTLAFQGDNVFFYGEIAQGGGPLTTTDMGSGKSAALGYRQSAYIRNMQYAGNNTQYQPYPAQQIDFYDSDSTRYNHSYVAPGATNWGSYVYLGGYGAGGVTGA